MRPIQLILMLSLVLTGCASVKSVSQRPNEDGATRTFKSDPTKTVKAAKDSAVALGLSINSENQDGMVSIVIADRGMTGWSWGEIVRMRIGPWQDGGSYVRIVNDRVLITNYTATDFTEELFTHIGQRLGEYP